MAAPIVLLHGANGSARDMAPLARRLSDFELRIPDLLGHGGRPVPERLRVAATADDLADWIDQEKTGPAHFIGYSFGGYVALELARRQPERFRSLTLLAVKFFWDSNAITHVVHLTDPDRLARPGNPRAGQMAAVHGADRWREVTMANREMFAEFGRAGAPLGGADLEQIDCPVLVLSGEDDPLVPEAEARRVAACFPRARLGLWPGLAHPLINVPLVEVRHEFAAFVREVEANRFDPGPERRLRSRLVEEGTGNSGTKVRIRPIRKG